MKRQSSTLGYIPVSAAADTKHLYHLYEEAVAASDIYQEWGNKQDGLCCVTALPVGPVYTAIFYGIVCVRANKYFIKVR